MDSKLKKILKVNGEGLKASQKRLSDIYKFMFSLEDEVLCEYTDSFRLKKETYGEMKKKIECAAAGLYDKIGATHRFVALEMDNGPCWIVAFWAILKSGNKPYLVNLRYPASLSQGILNTLGVEYIICENSSALSGQSIAISSLNSTTTVPQEVFEDEIAFSSSATSMNEVVCFYSGKQISEQILNFEDIVKKEPRIAKHYKGSLKQLAFLPFYHVFGLFAVYFWFTFFGRTLVFLKDYSADTILKTVKRHNVTHIFAVPVLWHSIEKNVRVAVKKSGEKKEKKFEKALKFTTALQNVCPTLGSAVAKSLLSEVTDKLFGKSVMFCINGGSYLKDSALQLLNGIGYNTYNGYGMSEIGITSVELRRKAKERNQNSIGRPFSSVEYALDQNGILQVRGSSLCTKKLVNGKEQIFDGWFNTGDIVSEKCGNYFIHGRDSDVVIGENGENINPDSVEKLFSIDGVTALSVLGLDGENGEELSLVAGLGEFVSQQKLSCIKNEIYEINATLPSATAVKSFYFTKDSLCPPTAIKVSRVQLKRKIKNGEVTLVSFADMTGFGESGENSELYFEIRKIMAECLNIEEDKIRGDEHIFNELGASSIEYFTLLSRLSERFSLGDFQNGEKYCYTLKEICNYIEKNV